ncbi:MAG TPA: pyridoxal-phosphate dependent enzyme [Candidatus Limnocylindrales bacterium]|nr:pyridoxal-phosphate dependent enzyme [Candidatus Limnocylindrales bacterium]
MCGWRCAPAFVLVCPRCGEALEPELNLAHAQVRDEQDPGLAYFDFLPLDSPTFLDPGGMWRTPCRPAPELGAAIGAPGLWLKDESVHPTGTTKDRMAAAVIAVFRQFGITEFVAASTGNSSTALARAVQRDGSMRAHFFCGAEFRRFHDFEPDDRVTLTVVEANYAAASAAAKAFAGANGFRWEGGYFNWARREGLKIAYLEAFDALEHQPDVVVQAISSGMGMAAAHKGVREFQQVGRMTRMPRFLMVQQDTCAPMARAWAEGRAELTDADVVEQPTGLATAILLGDARATYPYMATIAKDSGGSIVAVSQRDLVSARQLLADLEKIDVCYSAAATVAAVRAEAQAGRIDPGETVLVNLTGRHG